MELIVFLSAVFLCLMYYMHYYMKCDRLAVNTKDAWKLNDKYALLILLAAGFFIRLVFGIQQYEKATELNNFRWVADTIMNNGYKSVYESGVNISFPPFLVHVMALVGVVCKLFGLDSNTLGTTAAIIVFKLPSIFCDLAIIAIIYKVAKRKFATRGAMLAAFAFVLNPCSIMVTSIWSQIDGMVSLCTMLVCFFLYEKKSGFAVIAFALAVLLNPLAVIFTPVLVVGIIDDLILDGFNVKKTVQFLICLAGSIIGGILICIPMGLGTVWNNFTAAYEGYPYCSVNAYNFWNMIGKNWSPETATYLGLTCRAWGSLIVCLCTIAAIVLHYLNKRNKIHYFYMAALLVTSVFTFSTRMHERYLFMVMPVLLMLYVLKPVIENYIFYVVFTMIQFGNVIFVFYKYDASAFNPNETFPDMVSKVLFITFILFIVMSIYRLRHKETEKEIEAAVETKVSEDTKKAKKTFVIETSSKMPKWTKYDTIAVLIITIVYSGFALHDIGNRYAPETQWTYNTGTDDTSNQIILDLGESKTVQYFNYYLGNYENREYSIKSSETLDGPSETEVQGTMVSVFCWGKENVALTGRYITITITSDKAAISEIVLQDAEENIITPVNASDYPELFDETSMFPKRSTFRDSTYFDEIYHARTAYEFVHGLTSYENTHPPLGKVIMSIGIMIFGMNPFGWRIMGILFGIAMIPIFYAFSRRIFKESWIAAVSTTLFAFDFMHFAQTRIATIDVFVTLFIICSYYYMYRYYKMSFYDTPLKKTFIILGLCGFFMGCQMAAKWTGVYAAGGLAVLFFITLGKRYREYLYAKKDINGTTNGISHDYIVKNFRSKTVKTIGFCCIVFLVVPAIIYLLSYIPFKDYEGTTNLVTKMLKNQELMFTYHNGVHQEHPYSSRWWQWPIMYRPIWYYSGHVSDTISEGISSFGNPAVWWAGIAAFFYLLQRTIRKKDKKALFIVIAYLSQYLPWVFIGRTTFIYHYFTSVPFVTLMVAYCLYLLVKEKKVPKGVIYGYTAVAVVLFVMFYPVLSGQPVNKEYVSVFLRWFESWVLVS